MRTAIFLRCWGTLRRQSEADLAGEGPTAVRPLCIDAEHHGPSTELRACSELLREALPAPKVLNKSAQGKRVERAPPWVRFPNVCTPQRGTTRILFCPVGAGAPLTALPRAALVPRLPWAVLRRAFGPVGSERGKFRTRSRVARDTRVIMSSDGLKPSREWAVTEHRPSSWGRWRASSDRNDRISTAVRDSCRLPWGFFVV